MVIKVPYRINWAGAYLDCIEAPVITSTLDKYITAKSSKRKDKRLSIKSKEFSSFIYETDLQPSLTKNNNWTDYVNGCITVFTRHNFKLTTGCDIVISNDLPSGLGVSSSAAFIISIIKTLCYWNNLELSDNLIAKFGYWVEHHYLQIPCGRMDFKAVLHKPGIWLIDTSTDSLDADRQLDNKHYSGLLIYNEQHNHSADDRFLNLVAKIKAAGQNTIEGQFIHFEECIIDSINWRASEKGLDESWMGMCLNQSMLNLKVNLLDEKFEWADVSGLYGDKLVGSGLKGARFLLIDPAKKEEIKKVFSKEYIVTECII